ncbi:MAG: alpha/beta hydrolase [Gemmatimonadota bacterium]|nr:alpha/beta hydrolase [Gemmatimonadota bacterium]
MAELTPGRESPWSDGPGFLDVAGTQLEVRRFGPPPADSPPIVFLHEGLGSAGLWRDYPARLCEALGRSGLAYSRVGYGASEPVRRPRTVSFMHTEAHEVLPVLLDAAGLSRVDLYGHSDGASIALLFASRHPRRARSLVLEAPHVFVEDVTTTSIARINDAYGTTDLRGKMARWHDDPDGAFLGWTEVWLDPEFRSWDIQDVLPDVSAPVLVLQGEDDEYGSWAQVDAVVEGVAGPVRTRRLPECRHAPHRDQPDVALAEAVRFLMETAEPPGSG